MRDLVLIGNGPSVLNFDLKKIGEQYDTIGINGSFVKWMREDWYPTYQYIAREHPTQWGNHVHEFIEKAKGRVKKIFMTKINYVDEKADYLRRINVKRMKTFESPNKEKWADSVDYDIGVVCVRLINEGMSQEEVFERIKKRNDKLDPALNQGGLYKVLTEDDPKLTDDDYLDMLRFSNNFMWPKSFDEFYETDFANSATQSVQIGYLLGYRKVYLIGCDNNFEIKDGKMEVSSYHDDNMFYGMPYYVEEDIPCPVCRTTNGLRNAINDGWDNFLVAMSANDIDDLEIINCNPNSNVPFFKFDKLPLV